VSAACAPASAVPVTSVSTSTKAMALSFDDGDFALEPDPVLAPAEDTVESIELRLFSF